LLKGATGTGKTFVMAKVIAEVNRPTLVLCPNKTLVSQVARELRTYLPDNAVEMFFSFYDRYRPEAYLEATKTYIAKRASISSEFNALRHRATRALVERKDVCIVASVSCLYGLGMPRAYVESSRLWETGRAFGSAEELRGEVRELLFEEAATAEDVGPGDFFLDDSGAGELVLHVHPPSDPERSVLTFLNVGSGLEMRSESIYLYPARHHVCSRERVEKAAKSIERELLQQKAALRGRGDEAAADRLEEIVRGDLQLLRETGHCRGIENYSFHLSGRAAGSQPYTLLDWFDEDLLVVLDESHITIPQISAMYFGDRARKEKLVKHGFRLPSAMENRPLTSEEFWGSVSQTVFLSATPHAREKVWSSNAAREAGRPVEVPEMVIRPTFCLDPVISVHSKKDGVLEDVLRQLASQEERNEKTIILTVSKRDAEEMTTYLQEEGGVRCSYIHSDLNATERAQVLQNLQVGEISAVVGVNLLREGLDLPEVSLVLVLDADVMGFLRSETSLIQAVGRAARHREGRAVFYADQVTEAMATCIEETERRRSIQLEYNRANSLTPRTTRSSSMSSIFEIMGEDIQAEQRRISAFNSNSSRASSDEEIRPHVELKEMAKELPRVPGIYMFNDEKGTHLYIGKASNLRSRLMSYFQGSRPSDLRARRMEAMLRKAVDIETIECQCESEALVMEAQFIKAHQPVFNILLKDDTRFPWVLLTEGSLSSLPKFTVAYDARGSRRAFGPFVSSQSCREILQKLESKFQIANARVAAKYASSSDAVQKYLNLVEEACAWLEQDEDHQIGSLADWIRLSDDMQRTMAVDRKSALRGLASDLGLESPPTRIEAFDCSHLQGGSNRAACVVFVDGEQRPRMSRTFELPDTGGDDYASMEGAVRQRFSGSAVLPSLIVIDGGAGQLAAALRGLEAAGVANDVPVCALAKRKEEVFVPGRRDPLDVDPDGPAGLLLREVRDAAHAHALRAHRKARSTRYGEPRLPDLPEAKRIDVEG